MIKRACPGFLALLFSSCLLLPTFSAENTNLTFHPISPGSADGRIAYVTASMLESRQYLRQPFNDTVSAKFLDRYLESLDPQHLHFLQSDLAEFERYRAKLDDLTKSSNVKPGCDIFNRFMERLQQRVAFAEGLLKTEQFQFDTDERIMINRHEVPYPKDLDEAKQLWRERLRFEYLQEKLGKTTPKKKADSATDATDASEKKIDAKPKSESEEIVDTLTRRYNRNLRTFIDWNNEDVLQVYLGTLAHVYDPHSDYLGRAQLESFSISMSLRLFGIGAELLSDDGYCTIRRLLPEGPAEKSKKIEVGDRIVAVAQGEQPPVDVVEMNLSKAVQLIRGPKGTTVKLTILPKGGAASASKTVTLVRDAIKLEDQEAKAKVIELPGAGDGAPNLRLGVIDLPSFYATFDIDPKEKSEAKSTTADVARLITKLKQENVGGVILDLRRNGGGSLEEAIRLTGLFIKEGPVVQVKDTDGTVQEDADNDPAELYEGPLVVLTSRFSASASEIVAGALQDYGRALIVGDSCTHGKGTVQSVNQLRPFMGSFTNEPGALKMTIKKFYRASGASTQLRGVIPDISLPSVVNESKDIGESALENPLAYDTIASAKYEKLNLVAPYLPELTKRSAQRVQSEKEFAYVREDIEQFKKVQADKTISLNEKERLREKEESEARQKARDKERLARQDPQEKVYELTLRQVDLPGLPPPVEKTNASLSKVTSRNGVGLALVSTNSDSASISTSRERIPSTPSLDDESDDEKPPAVDAPLIETEHILIDYLAILAKDKSLTAVH